MSKELKHKLFTDSDCISEQTMFDYIAHQLSPKDQHMVEKHMLDCDLCSDALEGLTLLNDRNRIKVIDRLIKERIANKNSKVIGINYKILISIAAGFLLLTGGIFFFRFYSNDFMENKKDMADLKAPAEKEVISNNALPVTSDSVSLKQTIVSEEKQSSGKDDKKGKIKTEEKQENSEQETNHSERASGAGQAVSSGEDLSSKKPTAADKDLKQIPDSKIELDETITPENSVSQNIPYKADESKDMAAGAKNEDQNNEGYYAKEQTVTKAAEKNNKENKKRELKTEELSKNNQNPAYAPTEVLKQSDNLNTVATGSTINKNSGLISASDSSQLTDYEEAFAVVDEMPEFPGGINEMNKFIRSNLNYSKFSKIPENAVTKIMVQFIIDKDGSIKNPKVIKGINAETDKEALRVVNLMPKWKPGKLNGNKVPVIYNLPIQLDYK
jgi:hypothetical protein